MYFNFITHCLYFYEGFGNIFYFKIEILFAVTVLCVMFIKEVSAVKQKIKIKFEYLKEVVCNTEISPRIFSIMK